MTEIIAGRRQVGSYDLLLRIAEGQDVPRGWMGLAFDLDTAQLAARLDDAVLLASSSTNVT